MIYIMLYVYVMIYKSYLYVFELIVNIDEYITLMTKTMIIRYI